MKVAQRAEALGYRGLWTFQRLLYALEPRDQYYGAPGAAWPTPFQSVMDPLAVLAFVAAHTRTIRLGVSVLIMPIYQPVVLAKQLATLDVLSSGGSTWAWGSAGHVTSTRRPVRNGRAAARGPMSSCAA